jgi:hypothetical protein
MSESRPKSAAAPERAGDAGVSASRTEGAQAAARDAGDDAAQNVFAETTRMVMEELREHEQRRLAQQGRDKERYLREVNEELERRLAEEKQEKYQPLDEAALERALRKRLSATAKLPVRFQRPSSPPALAYGRGLYRETVAKLASGTWKEKQRLNCRASDGFQSEGRALVTDERGRPRALTDAGGTEHSYGVFRYFFDEAAHVRLVFAILANEGGMHAEYLIALGTNGSVTSCDRVIFARGKFFYDLCDTERTWAIDGLTQFDWCTD